MVEIAREKYWMVVIMAMAIATATVAQYQPCVQELVSCSGYENSTRPPASCCVPLKKVVTEELECLCAAINSTAGFDFDAALELVNHCNITGVSRSLCSGTPPTNSPSPPGDYSPPGDNSPPGPSTSGSNSPQGPKDSNAVHRTIGIEMPSFLSLFFFFWSMMAYDYPPCLVCF